MWTPRNLKLATLGGDTVDAGVDKVQNRGGIGINIRVGVHCDLSCKHIPVCVLKPGAVVQSLLPLATA